jgi:hypothetical protein
MLEIIRQPWSWWVSGMVISTIMFSLLFFGKSFGFSSNLRTICAIGGAGRVNKFFDFNWENPNLESGFFGWGHHRRFHCQRIPFNRGSRSDF